MSIASRTRCELFSKPVVTQFTWRDEDALARRLKDLDDYTTVHPISDFSEFQLQDDGRTVQGKYHLTAAAFKQIAQVVAPGLTRFLPDLSGMTRHAEPRDGLIDGAKAVEIWNKMAELRFPMFLHYRIIRNEKDRTIEGLVGTKHQFLENVELYHVAREAIQKNQRTMLMYAAMLIGRRLVLWFRNKEPFHCVKVDGQDWPFYSGYYFCHSEATGTAVRATLAVFTRHGPCLGPYRHYGGKVSHTGKDFFQRLGVMLDDVTTRALPVELLQQGIASLQTRSLGYEAHWEKSQRRERSKMLLHALCHHGIQRSLAAELIQEAMDVGRAAGDSSARPVYQLGKLYAGRTLLDLLVVILRQAMDLDFQRREKLAQAAFIVLTGQITI